MNPTCDDCGRPVADNARLCPRCTTLLAKAVGDIGALAEELTTTRLRQSRTGGQATGVLSRSHVKPLVWDQRAAEAADDLRSTVVAWVRVVLEERGGRMPDDTMPALGVFLMAHIEWLRHHPAAAECSDEIRHAVGRGWHAVDSASPRLYAGPCDPEGRHGDEPCPTDLYAREGAAEVTCPACELVWDVQGRREFLLESAGDRLVTAADLSRFLTAYGEPLTAERIRQWAARGQLIPHGHDTRARALYRVSEAVDLLADLTTRTRKGA